MGTKKIVIVSTSGSVLKGHPTGLWIEELAAPYYAWKEAGYEVVIASTKGGPIPIDSNSMAGDFFTEPSKKLMHDKDAVHGLSHSLAVTDIDWSTVDAIFLPGGHGTCVDFVDNKELTAAIETMYNSGKIVSSVCHGPTALCDCKAADGTTPLVAGKAVTGFSDEEENLVQLQSLVPFLLESKLRELGAKFEKGDNWTSKVCVDGNLITGQNPQSSEAVAKAVIEALG
jgi:putative intracellular protease/amidase